MEDLKKFGQAFVLSVTMFFLLWVIGITVLWLADVIGNFLASNLTVRALIDNYVWPFIQEHVLALGLWFGLFLMAVIVVFDIQIGSSY